MNGKYDDIINLPHHVSKTHKHMPIADRAAQFSAFAALKGYDDAIDETARITENKIELDESEKAVLNERLNIIADNISARPTVSVTYFKPDEKKNGGAYLTVTGNVKKIDDYERQLVMTDGTKIPFNSIIEFKCDLFNKENL
jgi:hypothetical protein